MGQSANKEQIKAIEHHGGVILSAGAGSGKTFVLVEHIVFLARDFVAQMPSSISSIERASRLKNYFSKVVLMTYTKKAAGELIVRIKKKLEKLKIEETSFPWENIIQATNSMYVGTIHGFCYRLLGQGFFPEMGSDLKLVSEVVIAKRIESLFNQWFAANKKRLARELPDLYEIILTSRSELITSLINVFSAPDLRERWVNMAEVAQAQDYIEEFDHALLSLLEVGETLDERPCLDEFDGVKNKWVRYLEVFWQWRDSSKRFHPGELESLIDRLKETGASKPRAKSVSDEIKNYYVAVKTYVDYYKKNLEDISAYLNPENTQWRQYFQSFKSIVDYVHQHYQASDGVSFADLEYSVLEGLKRKETCRAISKSYQYFIVDEFQDTSQIQFEIIEKLVDYDYQKLFCVGDVKQAIYAFRGGEVNVFRKTAELVPTRLPLANNYRSFPDIIHFNNELFDCLFEKTIGFESSAQGDKHSVEVEFQKVPQEKKYDQVFNGIYRHHVEVLKEPEEKITSSEVNQMEAEFLFRRIEKMLEDDSDSEICILYKNLTPSLMLVERILSSDFNFKGQVKVPLEEDPVICLFYYYLQFLVMDQRGLEKYKKTCSTLFNLHLKLMGQDCGATSFLDQSCEHFREWGIEKSFDKLLYRLGLLNSNFGNNQSLISDLIALSYNDLDACLALLSDFTKGKYSIEFQLSGKRGRVIIMTTHASKGLQFDHIFLGGIHTNGKTLADYGDFGKEMGSFKWKSTSSQSKKFTMPQMLIEREMTKKKDFSELKRLFYVACTRAVRSIFWVDLESEHKSLQTSKSSWVNGLSVYLKETMDSKVHTDFEQVHLDEIIQKSQSVKISPPLFHRDSLGIYFEGIRESSELVAFSDLSVTRLAQITLCPRKFYFKNILKIDPNDLIEISDTMRVDENEIHKNDLEEELLTFSKDITLDEIASGEKNRITSSSSERGIAIHNEISEFIKRGMVLPRTISYEGTKEILLWLKEEFDSQGHQASEFISERPLKFSLFSQMISGIPDLIIRNGKKVSIWDFKTGARKPETEQSYWFQLYCYAYAAYSLFQLNGEETAVELVLSYVDQKNNVFKKVNKTDIVSQLSSHWANLNRFDKVNEKHCQVCPFGNLCH